MSHSISINMNNRVRNLLLYIGFMGICMFVPVVSAYVLSGVMTLLGLVFLIENSNTLKAIAYHCNKLLDIAIFAFGVYCKLHLGVTIGMAMVFAGLGYSMVYGPYVRDMYRMKQNKSKIK